TAVPGPRAGSAGPGTWVAVTSGSTAASAFSSSTRRRKSGDCGYLVLHGDPAVAALKHLHGVADVLPRRRVLHADPAVAALKHQSSPVPKAHAVLAPPGRRRRRRIEASCPGGHRSGVSWVPHGPPAVAALKRRGPGP